MGSVEAIHQIIGEAFSQFLAAKPELLNGADAQGNTALHYAVAQHNLDSIEILIKQGAPITAKNHLGETAADWFQEYVTSASACICSPSQLAELGQEIAKNNVKFVIDSLKAGVSRTLRFAQGETLLHYAVEAQQKVIVELLLEGISHDAIERLLHLKNIQGVTPLALAKQRVQTGGRIAQEIVNSLREALRAAAAGEAAAALQTPPPQPLLAPNSLEYQEIRALADSLTHPLTSIDFESLNPQRSTIVKLSYHICYQAHQNYLELFPPTAPSRKQQQVIKGLLKKLFGGWDDNTQLKFVKKLESIVGYLAYLIQQRQTDQVIHFSDEKMYARGWCNHVKCKIFLNPRIINNVVSLVTTLIHELTHLVSQSYDFFPPSYEISKEVFFIDVSKAKQLAATGAAESLTQEQRKLFEIRQLLEEGFSDYWKQNLYQWMALNSAETLAQAILALATLPAGYAELTGSKQQPLLCIPSEKFLSAYAGEITFDSPEAKRTKKRHCVDGYGSPESISTWTGSDRERSPDSELASPSTLGEKVAGLTDTESAVIAYPSGNPADRPLGDAPFAVSGPTDDRLS